MAMAQDRQAEYCVIGLCCFLPGRGGNGQPDQWVFDTRATAVDIGPVKIDSRDGSTGKIAPQRQQFIAARAAEGHNAAAIAVTQCRDSEPEKPRITVRQRVMIWLETALHPMTHPVTYAKDRVAERIDQAGAFSRKGHILGYSPRNSKMHLRVK
jgi:hypothetical protein